MAEAIGFVASVAQVGGAGIQLSRTPFLYADGVVTADRRIMMLRKIYGRQVSSIGS